MNLRYNGAMQDDLHLPTACARFEVLAERSPRHAVRLARRWLADRPGDPWCQYALGWALVQWEHFAEAHPLIEAMHSRSSHTALGLRCQYALLLIELYQTPSQSTALAFTRLAETWAQAHTPQLVDAFRARRSAAQVAYILGHADQALAQLDRLAPELAHMPALEQLRWLRLRAAALIVAGNLADAEALLADAIVLGQAAHAQPDLGRCLHLCGWLALRREALDTALDYYQRAYAVLARAALPLQSAYAAKGIGITLLQLGQYDAALATLLTTADQFAAFGNPGEACHCEQSLGTIAYYTARWDLAARIYTHVAEQYARLDMGWYARLARRNLALVLREQGLLAEASHVLAECLTAATSHGDMTEQAQIWNQQAGLLSDMGAYTAANDLYEQAARVFQQVGNRSDAAECRMEQGWVFLIQQQTQSALDAFQAVGAALDQHPHHAWRVAYGRAQVATAQGELPGALAYYCAAASILATLRRRLASEIVSSAMARRAATMMHAALGLAVRLDAPVQLLQLAEYQRALTLQSLLLHAESMPAARQLDQLLNAYLHAHATPAVHERPVLTALLSTHGQIVESTFDLEQLRSALVARYAEQWTVISYQWIEDSLTGVVVTPESVRLERIPDTPILRLLLHQACLPAFRKLTYRDIAFQTGQSTQPWANLERLATMLLPARVQERIEPGHRLLIVPTGALLGLPWAALRIRDHWLVELADLAVLPSLFVGQHLLARQPALSTRRLLVGCSEFGARAAGLPGVAAELASLEHVTPQPYDLLSDTTATCSRLLAQLNRPQAYRLIHIASHAWLRPEQGQAAHLKLFDGDLSLDQIVQLRLDGAIILLSACDGVALDQLPGDEALSLSWAFLAAGAAGVIGSLWPAHEQPTQALMSQLHTLIANGHEPAQALAWVQRTHIGHSSTALGSEPEHWVGFQYIGA